jgi:hypothetical protein
MRPAAGVGCTVPALQDDGPNMMAFLLLEHLGKGHGVAVADLSGRTTQVEQALPAIVQECDGAPGLGFGFGVRHGLTLLGREGEKAVWTSVLKFRSEVKSKLSGARTSISHFCEVERKKAAHSDRRESYRKAIER